MRVKSCAVATAWSLTARNTAAVAAFEAVMVLMRHEQLSQTRRSV
jgi:hypothetical protein